MSKRKNRHVEDKANEKAFLYMLAIPLNVLVDQWGDEAKEKAPEFIEEVIGLYEAVQDGYVSDNQLAALLEEMAGVKIEAGWLKKNEESSNKEEK